MLRDALCGMCPYGHSPGQSNEEVVQVNKSMHNKANVLVLMSVADLEEDPGVQRNLPFASTM